MKEQLLGAFLISLLHGLIPSHWLPMVSIAKHQGWNLQKTLRFSFLLAMSHAVSTILIGLVIATQSNLFVNVHASWFKWIPASLLAGLGIWFLYRHHKHHHFHNTTLIRMLFSGYGLCYWPCSCLHAWK